MPKQIFEIYRNNEAEPLKLETLESLVRNIRRDTEWEIREIVPQPTGIRREDAKYV